MRHFRESLTSSIPKEHCVLGGKTSTRIWKPYEMLSQHYFVFIYLFVVVVVGGGMKSELFLNKNDDKEPIH